MRKLTWNSLTGRFFFASLVFLPGFVLLCAYMLEKSHRSSLETAEHEALKAHLYSLLGSADISESGIEFTSPLSDPRFSSPESGLYALIHTKNDRFKWQSESYGQTLALTQLPKAILNSTIEPGEFEFRILTFKANEYFYTSIQTIWDINGKDQTIQFSVLHNIEDFLIELTSYRKTLWFWLGVLSATLILFQVIVIRWALYPLRTIADDIKDIEKGNKTLIDKQYPIEIQPVTNNINILLKAEAAQKSRYKNMLGDLAHSLKTPLAVIRSNLSYSDSDSTSDSGNNLYNNLDSNSYNTLDGSLDGNLDIKSKKADIDEQIDRMSNIIQHQLNRASARLKNNYLKPITIEPIILRLTSAINKIYPNVKVNVDIESQLTVLLEEDDLMEVLGNIIENAFKYSSNQICVSAARTTDAFIEVYVDDNGKGIEKTQRKTILDRGARLDSGQTGQGIGLTVATEILSGYDGGLSISDSPLGGARFVIQLPN